MSDPKSEITHKPLLNRFAAIILAAGMSSRMGQPKSLLPLGDTTFLEKSITLFKNIDIQDICVVVGHRHTDLLPLIESNNARAVVNLQYNEGMFSSVIAGLKTLHPETDAFFIMPVDIPMVSPTTIHCLINAYENAENNIIYPVFNNRKGHPPLIPFSLVNKIIDWEQPGGLNTVLTSIAPPGIRLEVADPFILFDIDTPEKYLELLWICENQYDKQT